MSRRRSALLVVACLLAGCPAPGLPVGPGASAGPGVKPSVKPSAKPSGLPTAPAGTVKPPLGAVKLQGIVSANVIARDGASVIARDGASVIARDGAGVIARDGASLTGTAKLPAGLIGNDGSTLIGNDGSTLIGNDGSTLIGNDGSTLIGNDGSTLIGNDGSTYRLAALPAEIPVKLGWVYLATAKGELVTGADGELLAARTDAQGKFTFPGVATTKNLIAVIPLEKRGFVTAVVPRGGAQVGMDLASSLTATYVHDKYVKGQADPNATFERLPADLEAAARAAVGKAVAATDKPPAELGAETVGKLVDALRKADPSVEGKLEDVRKALVGGLSNQGVGEPADDLETDAQDLAMDPAGRVVFSSPMTLRVFRKDAQGKLEVVAGSGIMPGARPAPGQPAPGDGGPASRAPMVPIAIAYAADGSLLILDGELRSVRRVASDGTISTVVASDDWKGPRDLAVEPDGGLLVATHTGIWRVPPGGQPQLLAGESKELTPRSFLTEVASGDGGPAAAARFRSIDSMARDPRDGSVWVWDLGAGVRRIADGQIARAVGVDAPGFGGDGGPPLAAQLGPSGALAFRPDGTLLLGDKANLRLREVAGGTIRTLAGNGKPRHGDAGAALATGIGVISAIASAPDGALLFADRGYVRRLADGEVRTVVGGHVASEGARPATQVQLLGPHSLAYEAATHSMLVADSRHVWRLDLAAGTLTSLFGGGRDAEPFTEGQAAVATDLTAPNGLLVEDGGGITLMGTDGTTAAARVVSLVDGKLTTLAGGGTAAKFEDDQAAIGATLTGFNSGLVKLGDWYYHLEGANGRLSRFKPGERWLYVGGNQTVNPQYAGQIEARGMQFFFGRDLAVAPDGRLFIANDRAIFSMDPVTTMVLHEAGKSLGRTENEVPAREAKMESPTGLVWDAAGNLYWTETKTAVVRQLRKSDGLVRTIAGAGSSLLAGDTVDTGLGAPSGLAFDKDGDLYIADGRHGQIKVIRKAQIPQ